ncbi:DUF4192 family protein [Pseudarthrobacter sp. P1]|uniref:DUF4192 family protein n=1 Tax=Pseudarthrobacter sp. P1 TaxID=3418418 RepID=UPI003CF86F4E
MSNFERLTATSSQDVLSIIPFNLGFWPSASVVCIGVAGAAVRATLRVDLPDPEAGSLAGFAELVAQTLRNDPGANGTLLAIYGAQDWDGAGPGPAGALASVLAEELGRSGMPLRDGWYVGPEHWRHLHCVSAGCCPGAGQPLSGILTSTMSAELVFAGKSYEPDPAVRAAECVKPLPEPLARAIAAHTERAWPALAERALEARQFALLMQQWRLAMARLPQLPDPPAMGYLVASLRHATVRDAVQVMAAAGVQAAVRGAGFCGFLEASRGRSIRLAAPGPTAAERLLLDHEAAAAAGWESADYAAVLMAGTGGGPGPAPDWQRMEQAEALLRHLSRAADGSARAAALTMIGWIQWCKGRSSVAARYLHLALETCPGYRLAALLDELLAQGCVSGWATNPETAWRPSVGELG